MSTIDTTQKSDISLVDLLSERESMSIHEICEALGVTANAVRQRLNKLMAEGLVERTLVKQGRGRPGHVYMITEKARRKFSSNFSDLAIVLWEEIRSVEDPEVRTGLLQRIASALASKYEDKVQSDTLKGRMEGVGEVFEERGIPVQVLNDSTSGLPVLQIEACPYPDLAEHDRSICAVEKILFSTLLNENVQLSDCRLDGSSCCRFETT